MAAGPPLETGTPPAERTIASSLAVLTTPVLPADTNSYGNIFGGALVALIDKVASITAFRHARKNVVTASLDRVDFIRPVRLGDILTLRSRLNHAGTSSMEIEVDVEAEERLSGRAERACSAFLTFVAVDEDGRPSPVPRLRLDTDEERQRSEAGRLRAEERRQNRPDSRPRT